MYSYSSLVINKKEKKSTHCKMFSVAKKLYFVFCVLTSLIFTSKLICVNAKPSQEVYLRQQSEQNNILSKREYNRLRKELKREIQREKKRQKEIQKSNKFMENLDQLRESQEDLAQETESMVARNQRHGHHNNYNISQSLNNNEDRFNIEAARQNYTFVSMSRKRQDVLQSDFVSLQSQGKKKNNILPDKIERSATKRNTTSTKKSKSDVSTIDKHFTPKNLNNYYKVMYEFGIVEEIFSSR